MLVCDVDPTVLAMYKIPLIMGIYIKHGVHNVLVIHVAIGELWKYKQPNRSRCKR